MQLVGKMAIAGVCSALSVAGVASCSSGRPTPGRSEQTAAPATVAMPSSIAATLAAVPGCDATQKILARVLRTPIKTLDQSSSSDRSDAARTACHFDATLQGAGNPKVLVVLEYGRFAGEPAGRTGADIATAQAANLVTSVCRAHPKDLPGSHTYAQVCTNTDGPVRSGVGLVDTNGNYAAIDITIAAGTPTDKARPLVERDAQRLAADLLDGLG
jgi:hypothetical protein